MDHTTRAVVASLLILGIAACEKSKGGAKETFAPCDAATIAKLSADLTKANCYNVDLTVKANTDACAAMKTEMTGKRYALKDCAFLGQGNDEVSFATVGSDMPLSCVMKGGQAGVTDFRHAAMKLDMGKLRLDITGVIGMAGMKGHEKLQMTECQITAHE